ncbi:hypothetical protein PC121_g16640 [Phytophthora cactorum]|nr:hypothetical protein PC120_g3886 [Phytophthora cactorum]KAG3053758.1 hypothetical protein PC121_g16640 [Phytophthora cactorum]
MAGQATTNKHTPGEWLRVLAAYHAQRTDWLTVAANNGMPRPTAYRWASEDRDEALQGGDARAASTKVTPEIKAALESYLNENRQYTCKA